MGTPAMGSRPEVPFSIGTYEELGAGPAKSPDVTMRDSSDNGHHLQSLHGCKPQLATLGTIVHRGRMRHRDRHEVILDALFATEPLAVCCARSYVGRSAFLVGSPALAPFDKRAAAWTPRFTTQAS